MSCGGVRPGLSCRTAQGLLSRKNRLPVAWVTVTLLVPLLVVTVRGLALHPAGLVRLAFCCRVTLLVTGHDTVTVLPVCVSVRLGSPPVCTTWMSDEKPPVTEYGPLVMGVAGGVRLTMAL